MLLKLRRGQRLTSLYRDFEAASEIQRAYRHHRASSSQCIQAITRVIQEQMRRGCYISRHLRAGAADVRSRDMTPRERMIFREVVSSVREVALLEEGVPPHFHLQLR